MTDSKNKVHTDMLTEISIERMKQKNEMFVISGCRNRLVTRNKGQSLRDEFLAWKSAKRGTTIEEFLKEYNNAHDAELKKELDVTASTEKRTEIALEMLKLHEANQWTLAYVEAAPAYHAVNARIQNFLADGVWSDIYRDMGIAHCQCWFIAE